jgi:hypothetical protein
MNKTRCANFCKKKAPQIINKTVKAIAARLKKKYPKMKFLPHKKQTKKQKKYALDVCMRGYCNPHCKGTIFEEGAPNKLPDELLKRNKKFPSLVPFMKKTRKDIFNKKTNVLKDGFYEGLSPEKIKEYKKMGATSGCSVSLM